MFDVVRLRQLARTPRSGLHEVTDAAVHIALEPGYLHNPDSGVKIHLNAKINQHMADLNGILMGYDKVKKKPTAALLSDSPYIHLDVTGRFFVLKPVIGSSLPVTIIKKGDAHLGCLLYDIFNVSVVCPAAGRSSLGLGETVQVTVDRVSTVGERPVLLASLSPAASTSAESEGTDSGLELDTVITGIRAVGQGEKRKAEQMDGGAVDEAERKRLKKAAKAARKEQGRLEASQVAGGHDDTVDIAAAIGSQKKAIQFQGSGAVEKSPDKKARGGHSVKKTDLPEGFEMILRETENNKWKEFKGPDGKKYRSLKDIQKRFVEGVLPSPKKPKTEQPGSPQKSKAEEPGSPQKSKAEEPASPQKSVSPLKAESPKKAAVSVKAAAKEAKKEVAKNVVECIDGVVQHWNREAESSELLEDHPKYLVFSNKQIEEMEQVGAGRSRLLWVQAKKKAPKVKQEKPKEETAAATSDDAVFKTCMAAAMGKTENDTAITDMMAQLSETARKKIKKHKKKKEMIEEEVNTTENDSAMDSTTMAQLSETARKERKRLKKEKKKKQREQENFC